MDDPLSALDVHTGKKVFEELVLDLLKDTTRILVTHATHYVSQCDGIVLVRLFLVSKISYIYLLISIPSTHRYITTPQH